MLAAELLAQGTHTGLLGKKEPLEWERHEGERCPGSCRGTEESFRGADFSSIEHFSRTNKTHVRAPVITIEKSNRKRIVKAIGFLPF